MNTVTKTLCILTAGRGKRMGPYSEMINKALLPYKGKALISHIIEQFHSDDKIVVALGYQKKQIQDYLKISHGNRKIEFVEIENWDGDGAGPGRSLLECRHSIEGNFFVFACDTLAEDFDLTREANNRKSESWVAGAVVTANQSQAYCNLKTTKDGHVIGIRDKQKINENEEDVFAFTGICHINEEDAPLFWEGLSSEKLIEGEVQISNGLQNLVNRQKLKIKVIKWKDFGTWQLYKKNVSETGHYDFSKTDEFIYFIDDKVVKFFKNETTVNNRVQKSTFAPKVFPKITDKQGQFYAYKKCPGETLYKKCEIEVFNDFLNWCRENLWKPVQIEKSDFEKKCLEFYQDKTNARWSLFLKKYPGFKEAELCNSRKTDSVEVLLKKIDWSYLASGCAAFIHGDLQFDNILYDPQNKNFVLIDWRQDFAGLVECGDLYYDLAKLNGGLILNYASIKEGQFFYDRNNHQEKFQFNSAESCFELQQILKNHVDHQGFEWSKVEILTGLIFLNMAPLHEEPFDKLLVALAKTELTRILENY